MRKSGNFLIVRAYLNIGTIFEYQTIFEKFSRVEKVLDI